MEKKKRNFVEWAMHYRQIVILVVTCLVAFGIYSLPQMRKNEFPDFTVRQGIVVAVAPGNTAQEMVEQVTKPLEDYIFTYKEVKKEKTFSKSRDGITYIQVELNDDLTNKDEFWSKFKLLEKPRRHHIHPSGTQRRPHEQRRILEQVQARRITIQERTAEQRARPRRAR